MNCAKKQLSLLGVVATVALVFTGVAEADDSDSDSDSDELILFVDVDEASFDGPAEGFAGAFNVKGDTGSGAGTFQCWGWIFADGTANVSQVYNIPGGTIMTQGQEGLPIAVVGGTGEFNDVEGEALQTFTGIGFDFDIEFDLDD